MNIMVIITQDRVT